MAILLRSNAIGDRLVLLFNAGLNFKGYVLFVSLEELGPYVVSVVLVPELLQVLCSLLALDLLLDQLASLYRMQVFRLPLSFLMISGLTTFETWYSGY